MSGDRFAKREREKAKQERSARKRERRDLRRAGETDDDGAAPPAPRSQDEVLSDLAALHEEHESGRLAFDDFEVAKADLLAQLHVQ